MTSTFGYLNWCVFYYPSVSTQIGFCYYCWVNFLYFGVCNVILTFWCPSIALNMYIPGYINVFEIILGFSSTSMTVGTTNMFSLRNYASRQYLSILTKSAVNYLIISPLLKPKFFFRKYEYHFFTFSSPKKTWILHTTAGSLYILHSIMWSSNILHVKNSFNICVCVCVLSFIFFKEKLMCQVRNMIETYLFSSRKMETKSTYCFFWFIGLLFQWNIIPCLHIYIFTILKAHLVSMCKFFNCRKINIVWKKSYPICCLCFYLHKFLDKTVNNFRSLSVF